MDAAALLLVLLTLVLLCGTLYVFLVGRSVPVPRDWSGRPRGGSATPGETSHDAD